MRTERWYWFIAFCLASLAIHVGLALKSGRLTVPVPDKPTEIEVALQPMTESPIVKPVSQQKPAQQPKPRQNPADRPSTTPRDRRLMSKAIAALPSLSPVAPNSIRPIIDTAEPRPRAHMAEPGGLDPTKLERPLPIGLPSGVKDAGVPKLDRIARAIPGGGGSPAPGPVLGGHGGAPGPEAPPEDILFNGGGAGGKNLPREAPRIGGGGGSSVLSVQNPLAKEVVPEDKPGLGPGSGGGQGLGGGGGVGYGRGQGIGTKLDGRAALATLHAKEGAGIGAGAGSGIGTKPPGGGHGTGAEMPGTGGTGIGYGRGSGIGIGNGSGVGIGDGSGGRIGRMRGVPFGDITGLLNGDPNGGGGRGGGPGGPGRGAVFGTGGGGGGGGPISVVYMLDVSGSMGDDNKLGKAEAALKKALHELRETDSFNIVQFYGGCRSFSDAMVPATRGNVMAAEVYIDTLMLKPGTNLAAALEMGLGFEGANQLYILSDGEPTVGVRNPRQIRAIARELNSRHIQINTLALGLGEHFDGVELLRAIAAEHHGQFNYIDLHSR